MKDRLVRVLRWIFVDGGLLGLKGYIEFILFYFPSFVFARILIAYGFDLWVCLLGFFTMCAGLIAIFWWHRDDLPRSWILDDKDKKDQKKR